jgi:hypothetical protein
MRRKVDIETNDLSVDDAQKDFLIECAENNN